MSVRCKMKCEAVITTWSGHEFLYEIKLLPVTHGSIENAEFFRYTPYGQLSFGSVSAHEFEPGKEYYIDLTEAPASV